MACFPHLTRRVLMHADEDTLKRRRTPTHFCASVRARSWSVYLRRRLGPFSGFLSFLGQRSRPRSRFMQCPGDNDLAQSGAVFDFAESCLPTSVMLVSAGSNSLACFSTHTLPDNFLTGGDGVGQSWRGK